MVSDRTFIVHMCILEVRSFMWFQAEGYLSGSSFKVTFSKIFNIGHNFCMVSEETFIFHMCIPCAKTFSLLLSSRSFVKVKVKHQVVIYLSMKKGNVLHKQKLDCLILLYSSPEILLKSFLGILSLPIIKQRGLFCNPL